MKRGIEGSGEGCYAINKYFPFNLTMNVRNEQ